MFCLPIFLIALLPKPQRSHCYACVCETALSEKYSVPNIKVFSAGYVWCSIPLPLAKVVLIVFWTVLAAVIEGMFLKWQ